VVVHNRSVYAQGPPEQIVTPDIIQKAFGIQADISRCPVYGTPLCVAYGRKAKRTGPQRSTQHHSAAGGTAS
jgi:iron complex transport system ATP-binding protein